ncbi:MAG: hypothetical protein A2W11_09655 [Ignavibacteria bacterium RBG_16_35_7]|nr:MAG: hypothetical protein A2W11_09655 [Ignavibacteria bacterium RBG_16_35_7]
MKKFFSLLFFVFCFLQGSIKAQDSLILKKNQVYVEALGNNYFGSVPINFVSVNLARKIGSGYGNNIFILSVGVSAFKSSYIDTSGLGWNYPKVTIITAPIGFLWRWNYKRNGLWLGLYYTSAFGKQSYVNDYAHQTIVSTPNYCFQLSPNLCYQFQSKSEKLFCKISYTPKIYASNFFEKNGFVYTIFPIWGGISIGGGW